MIFLNDFPVTIPVIVLIFERKNQKSKVPKHFKWKQLRAVLPLIKKPRFGVFEKKKNTEIRKSWRLKGDGNGG